MTMYASAQNTFEQVGKREDLANMVYRLDPEETPFQSNISRNGKASNTLIEWQTQALASPSANYALEGDVTAASAVTQRARIGNRCAISKKVYAVTGTARAVNVAGVSDELYEQRTLRSIELKRDMEITLLANTAQDGGSTTSARKLAGFPTFITNTDSTGLSAPATTPPTGDGTDTWKVTGSGTSARALTLSLLNGALKQAYIDGGNVKMIMMSPDRKVNFSTMALNPSGATAQVRLALTAPRPASLIGAVESWQSDFGLIDVVTNRQMASDSTFLNKAIFFVDPRYAEVCFLRSFQTEALAKTGDAFPEHVLCEYTLKVGAPKAHAILNNIES